MRINLINAPNPLISAKEQVLLNRGIPYERINTYINSTMATDVINAEKGFGFDLLYSAMNMLVSHIKRDDNIFIIVDSDVDGLTSAALLINYLQSAYPTWANSHLLWDFHDGKQHGLNDVIDDIEVARYGMVICPDSGSNDLVEIERLFKIGTDVLILDHHECDAFSPHAITINSQYNYHNNQLSGAGVVYQFCRFMDSCNNTDYAQKNIDLCALGLQADMQDIRSVETKTLIFEGCKSANIKNPLIRAAIDKNEFSFSKADYKPSEDNKLLVTPMGLSFFLIPQMNAICRSGTWDEKALVFNAMLYSKAYDIVPSTKRGHKLGETERILDQALRTLTNVKNRQTRTETAALELFEKKIEDEHLLDHKVILILTEPGVVDRNVAGLVANRLMSKHQRPVCVLTKVEVDGTVTYQGSMRGYSRTGVDNFKEICEASRGCIWSRGHQLAAGLCLDANKIDEFIEDTDAALGKISNDPIYYVDYKFDAGYIDGQTILDLAGMNDYLGTGIERPLVYITDIPLTNINLYKGNTLKISTPSGVDIMRFGITEEDFNNLSSCGGRINCVCRCNENIWNWTRKPQLIAEDWEIVPAAPQEIKKTDVVDMWNF